MTTTHNVEGLAAMRRALTCWVRDLGTDRWDERVQGLVRRVARRYVDAVDREVVVDVPLRDPVAAADALERLGEAVERRFAEAADHRWDLSWEEFRRLNGTSEMGLEELLAELHDVCRALEVPVPPAARDAAVAAVVWRAADKVEAPVRVVLTSGADYVVGSGEPEGVLQADAEAVLDAVTGRARPQDLEAAGRWVFEGPDDVRAAFERSFRV